MVEHRSSKLVIRRSRVRNLAAAGRDAEFSACALSGNYYLNREHHSPYHIVNNNTT